MASLAKEAGKKLVRATSIYLNTVRSAAAAGAGVGDEDREMDVAGNGPERSHRSGGSTVEAATGERLAGALAEKLEKPGPSGSYLLRGELSGGEKDTCGNLLLLEESTLLIKALAEKRRLQELDAGAEVRLDSSDRIKMTAGRVGLSVPSPMSD